MSSIPTVDEMIKDARDCYIYESGRRKDVDEGVFTINELAIYNYIYAWTNHNVPFKDDPAESDMAYKNTLKKAYIVASDAFKISELEAKACFEKICKRPTVAL